MNRSAAITRRATSEPEHRADANGAVMLDTYGRVGPELGVRIVQQILAGHPQLGASADGPSHAEVQLGVAWRVEVLQPPDATKDGIDLDAVREIERGAQPEQMM